MSSTPTPNPQPFKISTTLTTVKRSGSEVTRKIVELLLGAFTLVAALTWKDAVKSMFDAGGIFYVVGKWGPWANALFITVAVYFLTMWVQKWIVTPPPPCTTLCAPPATTAPPPPTTTRPPPPPPAFTHSPAPPGASWLL